MRTIKLTIRYDGAGYVGWQIQSGGASVQALLQRAVRTMTGEENDVVGASRTDAGVHALGQVAHFQTVGAIPLNGLRDGINSLLPRDVAVTAAEEAPPGFHARKDARSKRYLYRLAVVSVRDPFLEGRAWRLARRPDVEAIREASRCLVGKHDFSSFRGSGCASRHAVRTVERILIAERTLDREWAAGEGGEIAIVVDGEGFVRHMVRNIVGTLVEVGLGKRAAGDIPNILDGRDRRLAGLCAPAGGLYLVSVRY